MSGKISTQTLAGLVFVAAGASIADAAKQAGCSKAAIMRHRRKEWLAAGNEPRGSGRPRKGEMK